MSLLDKILEKSQDQTEKHASEWVSKAFDAAPSLIAKSPEELQPVVKGVVGALAIHRETLQNVAPSTFSVIVTRLAIGHEDDAKIAWLRDSASFGERMAARESANSSTLKAAQDSAAMWAAVKAAGLEVLKVAPTALPILLALL